ncbi:glycerol-3-phosphate responsive antiterminator [Mycoplasmatota bacterium]|nr:glycerol-3-phosphate responsive antiterminator [Mycoplasmatota bacterium]
MNEQVIPAISSFKKLKVFLDSDLNIGILMNFQLAQLESIVQQMKENKKIVLIHSELIKGLASDEYGAIYLIQELKVDGIISSKPKVIEVCKKRNVMGVYRFFIKDTISLEQSIDIGQRLRPDFVEILPASCFDLISDLKQKLGCEVWMGGLINSQKQIDQCFNHGAIAITTSNTDLW